MSLFKLLKTVHWEYIVSGRVEESGQQKKHPRSQDSCDPEPWTPFEGDIRDQPDLQHSWLKVEPTKIYLKKREKKKGGGKRPKV